MNKLEQARKEGYEVGYAQANSDAGLPKPIFDEIREEAMKEERERLIELLNRLENTGEQLEMEGKKYTEGHESCRQSLLKSLTNKDNE